MRRWIYAYRCLNFCLCVFNLTPVVPFISPTMLLNCPSLTTILSTAAENLERKSTCFRTTPVGSVFKTPEFGVNLNITFLSCTITTFSQCLHKRSTFLQTHISFHTPSLDLSLQSILPETQLFRRMEPSTRMNCSFFAKITSIYTKTRQKQNCGLRTNE